MHQPVRLPRYTFPEEIAHVITHGLGLAASIAGLAVLVVAASSLGDAWHVAGVAIFGTTLVMVYASSTLYHSVRQPRAKRILQRLDHAAIFLLIAGTYTPFALVTLRGAAGWTLLAIVWGLALVGIALEVYVPHRRSRVSPVLHLIMGWMVVIVAEPLVASLHPDGLSLLLFGGGAYMLGLLFYLWDQLPYNHAVWHLFVLAGSACHFSCVLGYVIPPLVGS